MKGREQDTEGELPTSSRSISERERPEDARVSGEIQRHIMRVQLKGRQTDVRGGYTATQVERRTLTGTRTEVW